MTFALIFGQLRAHLGRYLATIVAIAISVAFVLASVGVLRTMNASANAVFGLRYADSAVVVGHVGDRTSVSSDEEANQVAATEAEALDALRGLPGVRALSVDAQTNVRVKPPGQAQYVSTATALSTDDGLRWQKLAEGRLPEAPGQVAVRSDANLPIGSTFEVQPAGKDAPGMVTVVGLFDLSAQPDFRSSNPLYTVDEQIQQWAGTRGAGGDVRIASDGSVTAEQLATQVRERLVSIPNTDTYTVTTGSAEANRLTDTFIGGRELYSRTLIAFTVLAVAVAALVIATTFAVVFAARVREMALLRCLGASRTQIRLSALAESVLVGTLATAIGLGLGRLAVSVIIREAPRLGVTYPMQEVTVPGNAFLLASVVGVGVTIATVILPIWRATAGHPLLALRPVDVRPEPIWRQILLVTGGVALAVTAWAQLQDAVDARAVVKAGAWGVLCFLGALGIVAGALPALLGLLGTLTGWILGPVGLLGARNTARSPRRTAATASAILVGVTLTATMVTGIAVLGPAIQSRFVDKIPLDISINSPDGILPAELPDRLSGISGVQRSLVVTDMYILNQQGRTGLLRVAEPTAIREVMRQPLDLPGPGEIVIPNSSPLASGIKTGDTRTFTFFSKTRYEETRTLTVRKTTGQWIFADPASVPAWPVATLPSGAPWPEGVEVPKEFIPRTEVWLRMNSAQTSPSLNSALDEIRQAATESSPSIAITEAFASRTQLQKTVNTILTSTTLLLAIAVVIAIIGVANTLSLALSERERELALLRGVGVTRGGLRLMLLFETLLVATATSIIGLALGYYFGKLGASALVGAAQISNASPPLRDLGLVGLGGVLAALCAATLASVRAVQTRTPRT